MAMSQRFRDWNAISDYVYLNPHAEIVYQVDYHSVDGPRLRIRVGDLRFDQKFEGMKLELDIILKFLKEKGGRAVPRQREYDSFFT
jgi:hypothetical protein